MFIYYETHKRAHTNSPTDLLRCRGKAVTLHRRIKIKFEAGEKASGVAMQKITTTAAATASKKVELANRDREKISEPTMNLI